MHTLCPLQARKAAAKEMGLEQDEGSDTSDDEIRKVDGPSAGTAAAAAAAAAGERRVKHHIDSVGEQEEVDMGGGAASLLVLLSKSGSVHSCCVSPETCNLLDILL
jgi:hypothetical protein